MDFRLLSAQFDLQNTASSPKHIPPTWKHAPIEHLSLNIENRGGSKPPIVLELVETRLLAFPSQPTCPKSTGFPNAFPATAVSAGLGKVVSRSSPKRRWLSKGFFGHRPDGQRLSIDFPGRCQNGSRGPNPFPVIAGMAGASEAFFRFWGSLGRFSRCRRWSWGSPQRPRRSAETENGRTEGFQGPLGLIAGLAGLWELNFRHPPKWQALSMLLPK